MTSRTSIKFRCWFFSLWIGVVASSLFVVHVSNTCRVLTNQISNLEREANILQETWGKYLLEKGTHASLNNIESLAKNTLNMKNPQKGEFIAIVP